MEFNGVLVKAAVVSAASAGLLLPGPGALAAPSHGPAAGQAARQLGPWEPSSTTDPQDGDPGGVSGTARLQRWNTARPSGIDWASISFKAAGEFVTVDNGSPWTAHWYLDKNGSMRNQGTVSPGNKVHKNFNIREGERIGIRVCLSWAGGKVCTNNAGLRA